MILRRIGVFSAAKLFGLIYAVVGLVIGAIFSFFSLLGSAFSSGSGLESGFFAFGASAIIVFPIMYGIIGFVGTAILTWLFNIFVGITGGLELEFEQTSNSQMPPQTQL